jgi:hypothetical protein
MVKGYTSNDPAVRTEDVIIDNIHDSHFRRVGNPRLYEHRYQSSQLELWKPGEVEWFVIIRDTSRTRRPRRTGRILVIQPPLFSDGTRTL